MYLLSHLSLPDVGNWKLVCDNKVCIEKTELAAYDTIFYLLSFLYSLCACHKRWRVHWIASRFHERFMSPLNSSTIGGDRSRVASLRQHETLPPITWRRVVANCRGKKNSFRFDTFLVCAAFHCIIYQLHRRNRISNATQSTIRWRAESGLSNEKASQKWQRKLSTWSPSLARPGTVSILFLSLQNATINGMSWNCVAISIVCFHSVIAHKVPVWKCFINGL